MRTLGGTLQYTHSIDNLAGLRELNQFYTANVTRNLDGYLENRLIHLELWPVWDNGADAWSAIEFQREVVRHPFNIIGIDIQPGKYDTSQFIAAGSLPNTNRLRGRVFVSKGGFFSGNIFSVSGSLSYQRDEALNLWGEYSHSKIKFPSERKNSSADVGRLGLSYAFTAKNEFHALIQHNRVDDIWAANIRYSWQRSANAGLYLVYTHFSNNASTDSLEHQEFVLKYSHTFDLIN